MKKVSVIVPSYNHSKFVKQTVESIFSQDYPNLEVIVIDDGSKDDSVEILKDLNRSYPFKLITKNNEGLCATLNLGISLTNGEYIVLLASDDTFTLNRISEQVSFMESSKDVDVVTGGVNAIDANGKFLFSKIPLHLGEVELEALFQSNYIFAASCMIRRSTYETYGLYREDYRYEDYYLWLRIVSRGGKIVATENIWANYRYLSGDLSVKIRWYYDGLKQILSDYNKFPSVQKKLDREKFVFFIKIALWEGYGSIKKYKDEFLTLKWSKRIFIQALGLIPKSVRRAIYTWKSLKD